jgi:transcriptional regulator with PAS, ATPase and Fis domain
LDQIQALTSINVTLGDLSRLPVEQLARLLLEHAADDPILLRRLHVKVAQRTARPEHVRIIGGSLAMRHASELIRRFARTDDPVLITGESGTGKELAAQAIHDGSARGGGPFVALNCAAIPASLVASELFGYEKGAFTGAASRTKGRIEHAHGGTLFLDEIGDMPVDLQGHLLRFLQDGQIVRVGGRDPLGVNVRIVAATNVRLRQAIAEGRFREDLYYRINVLTLHLPPLRDRPDDIDALARHFLRAAATDFGRAVNDFEASALERLRRHSWPGNVRELMSTVRRAVVIGDAPLVMERDLIGLDSTVPSPAKSAQGPAPSSPPPPGSLQERAALVAALQQAGENVTKAARSLGVSRVTLYRMLRRHEMSLARESRSIVIRRGVQAGPTGSIPASAAGLQPVR